MPKASPTAQGPQAQQLPGSGETSRFKLEVEESKLCHPVPRIIHAYLITERTFSLKDNSYHPNNQGLELEVYRTYFGKCR